MMEENNSNQFDTEDITKNKGISALAYIIFFIPLIACAGSSFGKFHANQGLLLLITAVVGYIVLSIIPFIGWILLPLFSLAVFIYVIVGIVNAANGNAKELPVIGKFRIIK